MTTARTLGLLVFACGAFSLPGCNDLLDIREPSFDVLDAADAADAAEISQDDDNCDDRRCTPADAGVDPADAGDAGDER